MSKSNFVMVNIRGINIDVSLHNGDACIRNLLGDLDDIDEHSRSIFRELVLKHKLVYSIRTFVRWFSYVRNNECKTILEYYIDGRLSGISLDEYMKYMKLTPDRIYIVFNEIINYLGWFIPNCDEEIVYVILNSYYELLCDAIDVPYRTPNINWRYIYAISQLDITWSRDYDDKMCEMY